MYTLKKSLGQHFLKDEGVVKKILASLNECSFEHLLEVGPGGGALTRYLIEIPSINFKAVEIDDEKWKDIAYWKEKYDTAIEKYFKNYLPE